MAESAPDQGFLLFMAESLLAQAGDLAKEIDWRN